jgi:hypothetical protein
MELIGREAAPCSPKFMNHERHEVTRRSIVVVFLRALVQDSGTIQLRAKLTASVRFHYNR